MYKGLFLPLLMTLILHVALVMVFVVPWSGSEPLVKKATPNYVKAKLVTLEKAKPKPKPKPKTSKKVTKPKPKKVASKPVKKKPIAKKTTHTKTAQQKQRELEKQKQLEKQRELERQRLERERHEQEKREQELAEAMAAEEHQRQAESDAEVASSYIALIAEVIENNWSRPPSARNNMEAELILQLVPTGEVVGVSIVKGSGNTAFDRSAEQAVRKAERFPELQQLPPRVFENYFRRLRLKFRPEDLRR